MNLPLPRIPLTRLTLAALLCMVWALGCASEYKPGYAPVSGQVLINGEPEEGVVVRFHHTDSGVEGNAKYPVAKTDQEGRFTLSTSKDAPGALVGKYQVTFEWMSSNELNAVDRFNGRLARVETSTHEVEINAGKNELSPFELSWDEK